MQLINLIISKLTSLYLTVGWALVICREFSHGDYTNEWRKSTKEADIDKSFLLLFRK